MGIFPLPNAIWLFLFFSPSLPCGVYPDGAHFCYDDLDPECPSPREWEGFCDDGGYQSPIRLPEQTPFQPPNTYAIELQLSKYQATNFRLQNNGHTVVIKLHNNTDYEPSLAQWYNGERQQQRSEYYLDSIHFHWGDNDLHGSEHCFEHKCYAAEMHLVHLRTDFDSVLAAAESPDRNTILVVGVMLDTIEGAALFDGNPDLNPITQNLANIKNATDSETFLSVEENLDLASVLTTVTNKGRAFHYAGSLTTPQCEEKVSWYVYDKPIPVSPQQMEDFRSVCDFRGEILEENHRPIQKLKGRQIYVAEVRPAY